MTESIADGEQAYMRGTITSVSYSDEYEKNKHYLNCTDENGEVFTISIEDDRLQYPFLAQYAQIYPFAEGQTYDFYGMVKYSSPYLKIGDETIKVNIYPHIDLVYYEAVQ